MFLELKDFLNPQAVARLTGAIETVLLITHTPVDDGTVKVWHNLIYRNTSYGLLVSGVSDVRIYQNTFYKGLDYSF